jgi:5,10-methenyltetrahydrofolate synthetase
MTTLTRDAIMAWRRDTRQRLLAARLTLTVEQRVAASRAIRERLEACAGDLAGHTVSAYWPLRGEPDLRPWLADLHDRGVRCVMPLVVARGEPLKFRAWHPGCRMEKGFWDIPVPADGPFITPDLLIAPVVGFDAGGYRLGYGGGYFDRTLAALATPFRTLGVGYEAAALDSIHPLPHDIPLQAIVTEQRWHDPQAAGVGNPDNPGV